MIKVWIVLERFIIKKLFEVMGLFVNVLVIDCIKE